MTTDTQNKQWSSNANFLLAAVGFSVGLGNIWRFPYVMGENGGAAFLIIYLVCVVVIALPLLVSELAIGRLGRGSPVGSIVNVAQKVGVSKRWGSIGGLAVLCVYFVMTYYTVIAGWTFDYFVLSISGGFAGISNEGAGAVFASLTGNPLRMLFWHTVVNIILVVVLRQGIRGGIERAVRVLMPVLFVCLVVMVVYAVIAGDMPQAAAFLFTPDFSQVTIKTIMIAVGQAFFSIGIGMAALIAFGSYLSDDISIPRSAMIIVLADTGVAVMAGLAIFPLVFAFGLEPSEGPGLIFQTLPVAFGQMPGGQVFGSVFFFLLIAAAMTSCIGGTEAVVAWLDEHKGISRKKATLIVGFAIWLVGGLSILSFSEWSNYFPLDFIPAFAGKTIFDTIDFLAANILLILGGILTSVFIGWRVPKHVQLKAIGITESWFYRFWRFVVRFVVLPILLIVVVGGLAV
ncbi:MAG: sodium-dependent transporter [Alphaproteobacteria bacterium]|nr:MAG: sodium-dependent transporter [Alphaproteobacteria bacterium]